MQNGALLQAWPKPRAHGLHEEQAPREAMGLQGCDVLGSELWGQLWSSGTAVEIEGH